MGKKLDIMTISGIECYEENGTAYLKLEAVARGLGFTKTERSGNEVIRWSRVEQYLREFNAPTSGRNGYITECVFYRLAMKAKNDVAESFQRKIAEEILPTLRRTGHYEIQKPKNQMELLKHFFGAMQEIDAKVDSIADKADSLEKRYTELKNDTPLLGIDMDRVTNAVKRKGVELLGGKDSSAYSDRSLRSRTYNDIYNDLKRNFGVSSYKAIKRCECQTAVDIINSYKLPYVLEREIADTNAQITMEVGK